MNLSLITPRSLNRIPPPGWKKMWYEYFQMEKVISEEKKQRDKVTHASERSKTKPINGESFLEKQFFLNIVKSLSGHIDLFELGAGRGDWCLALAGVLDFKLIDTQTKSYRCLAVEGEPTHFEWTRTHFQEQGINAEAVHGAIWSSSGECQFYSVEDPASNYGQAVTEKGNITVPCYTLDFLMEKHGFEKIDIVHADVQGAEYEMLKGATKALSERRIKYMIIGTHLPDMNERIVNFVTPYGYESLYSVPCHSGVSMSPFGDVSLPVDGLLILKDKNL